ncbi:DUF938 domain-containing protein [Gilvimarinus xylanilyticus]|uniref:Class I SAM-dependent methyltransferase n=1 Tax=Gilvimarinus xylanilyticus TaxID=2944139 RepID=A0A9X2KTF2_9GAMM|nr:DUF938 domain-containing protein [Gilvimarinus xylanilyticus]MCP8899861.1 class I SAM-dependent methyltransferase [Gilvimarinus xylanilyticus]
MSLPFSQACENNKDPILAILKSAFAKSSRILEVGSGTGQHAVYFAPNLPHVIWQTSDLEINHAGINQWINAEPSDNLHRPVVFDLSNPQWPGKFNGVYSANTAHIVSWPLVQNLFHEVGQHLPQGGVFALYGPFNYGGKYTSDSNAAFDQMLRERDPASGIRDFEKIEALANENGLTLKEDCAMPANNRLLLWSKL